MVEMIIEKQIFGAKELEQLLQCFLSLNSPHHHRVIVGVFTEIWKLFFLIVLDQQKKKKKRFPPFLCIIS
ncbi:Transcription repressor OFP8 [Bienertia sinuspersici]